MKLFWTLALATIVTVSLSGCFDGTVKAVELQKVEATVVPLPELAQVVEPAEATVTPLAPVAPMEPVDSAPVIVPPVITPEPVDPLLEWLENPTFTCEPGRAPGWLNEEGVPTSCVAN
jgi:hypothetical protein